MRKSLGALCILLGVACLLASVAFIAYNRLEEKSAGNASLELLQDVQEEINAFSVEESFSAEETADAEDTIPEMPIGKVNGYDCIGVLSIPVLDIELPVLSDWDNEKLKVAPCKYFGSYYEADFVIAAHNYRSHFGKLSQLQSGDLVLFTDVTGELHCYEVVLLETLPGDATEEMITSGFDLSLYTCTTGGRSRVTVRCNSISDK